MDWVYLSPHLDDVAFSCGGLVWDQVQNGNQVSVWTVCAGDPPPGPLTPLANKLHARWGAGREAVHRRRAEDETACRILGADTKHFSIADCIYRRSTVNNQPYYPGDGDIFGELHPTEWYLVTELAVLLMQELPPQVNLVSPLAIGCHVDHNLVRLAAEHLDFPLWYYADYPYVLKDGDNQSNKIAEMTPVLMEVTDRGLDAWEHAVVAYSSQISTFWPNPQSASQSIRDYYQHFNGIRLWRSIPG